MWSRFLSIHYWNRPYGGLWIQELTPMTSSRIQISNAIRSVVTSSSVLVRGAGGAGGGASHPPPPSSPFSTTMIRRFLHSHHGQLYPSFFFSSPSSFSSLSSSSSFHSMSVSHQKKNSILESTFPWRNFDTSWNSHRNYTSSSSSSSSRIYSTRPIHTSTSLVTSSPLYFALLPTILSSFSPSSPSLLSVHPQPQRRGMASLKHKRVIRMAKGYRGRANRTFRAAIRRVEKGLQYAYRDRKTKKRNFRKLWIERLNAGVRQHGMSYSHFIHCLAKINRGNSRSGSSNGSGSGSVRKNTHREEDKNASFQKMTQKKRTKTISSDPLDSTIHRIDLNRRMLAELAANEPFSFKAVVDVVKKKSRE